MVRATIALLLVLLPIVATAQDQPGTWLLGKWKGAHVATTLIASDNAQFEFKREGDSITWKMERKGLSAQGGSYWSDASGVVSKLTDGELELEGKYTASSATRFIGNPVKYVFTRSGDSLSGTFIGAFQTHVPIKVDRVK